MTEQQLQDARKRMQQLHADSTRRLQQAQLLLDRQSTLVRQLESRGQPAELGHALRIEMAQAVDTLRWQCAWLEQHLRHPATLALHAQPHPWAEGPPADLLPLICLEIQRIQRDEPAARDPEVTDRAVQAAIARAAGGG